MAIASAMCRQCECNQNALIYSVPYCLGVPGKEETILIFRAAATELLLCKLCPCGGSTWAAACHLRVRSSGTLVAPSLAYAPEALWSSSNSL
jgi:hypothetical protein